MWPDRVSNPGPLTYESGALPTALRGLGRCKNMHYIYIYANMLLIVFISNTILKRYMFTNIQNFKCF